MARKTDSELQDQFNVIRDETERGANDEARISAAYTDLKDSAELLPETWTFSSSLTFDTNKWFNAFTMSSGLSFSFSGTGDTGKSIEGIIIGNGTHSVSFSSDFKVINNEFDNTLGTKNYFSFKYQASGEIVTSINIEGGGVGGTGSTSSGSTAFDWSRAIKALPFVGQVPGGTTIAEGLENIYYPFIEATISMNSFSLQEVGLSYSPNIIGTITLNDETVVTDRRVIDVTGGNTTLNNPAGNSINYTAPSIIIVSGTTNQYKIEADVGNNGSPTTIESPTRAVSGVYPFFHGMNSTAGMTGSTLYGALTKLVESQGNKNILLNGTNQKIYFCYPATYPDLSSILDQNGFEILGATFPATPDTRLVESTGLQSNYSINYKVYESTNSVTVTSSTFQFIF